MPDPEHLQELAVRNEGFRGGYDRPAVTPLPHQALNEEEVRLSAISPPNPSAPFYRLT